MLRLTILLGAALGIAMLVGGRTLSPEEAASLVRNRPVQRIPAPVVIAPVEVATPAAAPASDPVIAAAPEPAVSEDAVRAAVELAMATDTLESGPEAAPPEAAALPDAAVVEVQPAPETLPEPPAMSIEDEIAAALSDSQVWFINADRVNVREGPSTEFQIVGRVAIGDATEILSDPSGEWVHIRIQGDGVEGYVARRFLQQAEPNG